MPASNITWFEKIKSDFPASFVVFLIALPLSLGISLASGAPMEAGLIAAIVGGILVGSITGAPLQVSGPAAGLSVMVFSFVQKFGFEATCTITFIAGLAQIVFSMAGASQLAFIISPAVIHAMLAGIGVLITLGQFHVLLGFLPRSSAVLNMAGLSVSIQNMNTSATLLGVFSLLILLAWNKWIQKKFLYIPASLITVLIGTIAAILTEADVPRVQIKSSLIENMKIINFGNLSITTLMLSGFGLALVASAESLLCAVAIDKLHRGPRVHLRKELLAQGIGNAISGLFAGLPVTGVIVRSSANIAAGAKSNISAILHGLWILIFATFFASLLNQIPLSVLAALLIFTGIKLVKIGEIKKLMEVKESLVYFATLFGVVFIDLLWGISIGFTIALLLLIHRIVRFHFDVEKAEDTKNLKVNISGNLSFLSVPSLVKNLNALPKRSQISLVLNVNHLDHAAIEAIRDWKHDYEQDGAVLLHPSLANLSLNLNKKGPIFNGN